LALAAFGGTRTEKGDAVEKLRVLEAYRAGKLSLPPGYSLEFDADLILLRKGGATVAAFSVVPAATPSQVTKAAWEDTPGAKTTRLESVRPGPRALRRGP